MVQNWYGIVSKSNAFPRDTQLIQHENRKKTAMKAAFRDSIS